MVISRSYIGFWKPTATGANRTCISVDLLIHLRMVYIKFVARVAIFLFFLYDCISYSGFQTNNYGVSQESHLSLTGVREGDNVLLSWLTCGVSIGIFCSVYHLPDEWYYSLLRPTRLGWWDFGMFIYSYLHMLCSLLSFFLLGMNIAISCLVYGSKEWLFSVLSKSRLGAFWGDVGIYTLCYWHMCSLRANVIWQNEGKARLLKYLLLSWFIWGWNIIVHFFVHIRLLHLHFEFSTRIYITLWWDIGNYTNSHFLMCVVRVNDVWHNGSKARSLRGLSPPMCRKRERKHLISTYCSSNTIMPTINLYRVCYLPLVPWAFCALCQLITQNIPFYPNSSFILFCIIEAIHFFYRQIREQYKRRLVLRYLRDCCRKYIWNHGVDQKRRQLFGTSSLVVHPINSYYVLLCFIKGFCVVGGKLGLRKSQQVNICRRKASCCEKSAPGDVEYMLEDMGDRGICCCDPESVCCVSVDTDEEETAKLNSPREAFPDAIDMFEDMDGRGHCCCDSESVCCVSVDTDEEETVKLNSTREAFPGAIDMFEDMDGRGHYFPDQSPLDFVGHSKSCDDCEANLYNADIPSGPSPPRNGVHFNESGSPPLGHPPDCESERGDDSDSDDKDLKPLWHRNSLDDSDSDDDSYCDYNKDQLSNKHNEIETRLSSFDTTSAMNIAHHPSGIKRLTEIDKASCSSVLGTYRSIDETGISDSAFCDYLLELRGGGLQGGTGSSVDRDDNLDIASTQPGFRNTGSVEECKESISGGDKNEYPQKAASHQFAAPQCPRSSGSGDLALFDSNLVESLGSDRTSSSCRLGKSQKKKEDDSIERLRKAKNRVEAVGIWREVIAKIEDTNQLQTRIYDFFYSDIDSIQLDAFRIIGFLVDKDLGQDTTLLRDNADLIFNMDIGCHQKEHLENRRLCRRAQGQQNRRTDIIDRLQKGFATMIENHSDELSLLNERIKTWKSNPEGPFFMNKTSVLWICGYDQNSTQMHHTTFESKLSVLRLLENSLKEASNDRRHSGITEEELQVTQAYVVGFEEKKSN